MLGEYNDFLIGLAVIVLLYQITNIVRMGLKKYRQWFIPIVYGMIFFDGLIIISWTFGFKDQVEDVSALASGVGLAITLSMLHKIKKFLQDQKA